MSKRDENRTTRLLDALEGKIRGQKDEELLLLEVYLRKRDKKVKQSSFREKLRIYYSTTWHLTIDVSRALSIASIQPEQLEALQTEEEVTLFLRRAKVKRRMIGAVIMKWKERKEM